MNRRTTLVWLLAAMPGLLSAQETKLVNCRTLEAAGHFVGPDEVLDGDRVCQKLKPGALETAKTEPAKTVPGAVPGSSEPISVADAARANRAAKAKKEAEKTALQEKPAVLPVEPSAPTRAPVAAPSAAPAVTTSEPVDSVAIAPRRPIPPTWKPAPSEVVVAPEPVAVQATAPVAVAPPPVGAVAEQNARSVTPSVVAEPSPVESSSEPSAVAAPPSVPKLLPVQVSPEPVNEAPTAAFSSAVGPAPARTAVPAAPAVSPVPPQPVSAPASAVVVSSPAPVPLPAVRIHRDAPVAPGTPSEPPERDYGFSDVNAVETSSRTKVAAANTRATARHATESDVQVGAFDKSREETAAAPVQSTTVQSGNTQGFQEGQGTGCAKNITLGSVWNGKLVVGTPGWAQKWMERNQKRMANICFSAAPIKDAKNYLIVFYSSPANEQGQSNANSAVPLPDVTAANGTGGFTTKDGSTWQYAAERNGRGAAVTEDQAEEPHSQAGQVWYATAYAEEGTPVAERWPESSKRGDEDRASEDLLNAVVEDLRKL
jgi:hypothetical protein